MIELTDLERARLAQLYEWERRAIQFDGWAELRSHEQMHRHHETEPYIGCLFCRDKFMPVSEYQKLRDAAVAACEAEFTGERLAAMNRLREVLELRAGEADK